MKVRALTQSDTVIAGRRHALFEGIVYDLPSVQAAALITEGKAEPATPFREPEVKAIEYAPENKAVEPQVNKRGRPRRVS